MAAVEVRNEYDEYKMYMCRKMVSTSGISTENIPESTEHKHEEDMEELTESTSIGRQRLSCRGIGITHDKDVVNAIGTRAERILENSARPEDNF